MDGKLLAALCAGLMIASCSGADDERASADDAEENYAEQNYADGGDYAGAAATQYQQQQQYQPQQQQAVQQGQQQARQQGAQNRPAPGSMPMPQGSVRVEKAQVMDRNGFGKPMVAATMMVPAGWKVQGGINWQQNMSGCGPNTPHVNWAAIAPDGVGAMAILPDEAWSGMNANMPMPQQNQCPNVTTTDTKQIVLNYVQRHRPNSRVLDYRDRADEVQELNQMIQQNQQPDMYGSETKQWAGAGQALISYQVNGQEVREMIGTSVMFNVLRMPDAMGGVMETISIAVNPGFAMRMPEGKLDFKQVELFRKSGKPNPEWVKLITQHRQKIAGINAKGASDRAAIRRKSNQEIFQMQQDTYKNQQASRDRGNREFNEYIRGTETYNNSSGDSVELDNTYENAWELNDGTYVLTDDPSFNPYAVTGQDGQRLEPTQ